MAVLPEKIRQKLVELAKAHDGFVSIVDINQEFALAGYGDGKKEVWLMTWRQAGLLASKMIEGKKFYYFLETEQLIKAGKQFTLDRFGLPVVVYAKGNEVVTS